MAPLAGFCMYSNARMIGSKTKDQALKDSYKEEDVSLTHAASSVIKVRPAEDFWWQLSL